MICAALLELSANQAVAPLLVDALKRLEYRGYDSAGVATIEGDHLDRRRAEGKLVNLENRLKEFPLSGTCGHRPHQMGNSWCSQ